MSIYAYPSDLSLDGEVQKVLHNAWVGKSPTGRPKPLVAHQIVQRLPDHIVIPLIERGGIGGDKGSIGAPLAASQKVMFSLKRLRHQGLVRIRYIDCEGMAFKNRFDDDGTQPFIFPSYPVCASYEYTGYFARVIPGTTKVQISLGIE